MKTTIRQLIRALRVYLPPPIAHRAIRNMRIFVAHDPILFRRYLADKDEKVFSEDAIMWAFNWVNSREGSDYWLNVRVNEWRKS